MYDGKHSWRVGSAWIKKWALVDEKYDLYSTCLNASTKISTEGRRNFKTIFTGSHRHAGFITIKGLRVAEKWGSNEKGYKQVMQLVLSKL